MSASSAKSKSGSPEKPVYLISYPKIVLLYPTFIGAILAGLLTRFLPETSPVVDSVGWGFMWLFGLNLVVLSFDFPRTTSLTLFFLIMAAILGVVLLAMNFPGMLPAFFDTIRQIHPRANPTFYFLLSGILGFIYICVLIHVQFDYWEVRSNELLHHHGFLASLERYASPNMRITKEIDDIFEYLLMGSGRLVLHPRSEHRAFVLENVPFIASKEARITKLLGSLQVSVRSEEASRENGDDEVI